MNEAPHPAHDGLAPDGAVDLERAKREYRFLRRLLIASLACTCALLFSLNLVDPDLWGHVKYGQDWIAEGELPRTATHTFTAIGYPWINHENIAELTFAWGFDHLGVTAMMALKTLWGLSIVGLALFVAHRHNVRLLTAMACGTLMAIGLQAFFPMRPQLFSLMSCAWMLVLLDLGLRHPTDDTGRSPIRWRWLAGLPLVMIFWTNAHGGFLAGLAIVAAYLGGEALVRLRNGGRNEVRNAIGLVSVAIVTILSTLVNPYGWELIRWVISTLLLKRPEITEWAAPKPSDPVFMPLVLLVLAALASFAATKRKRNWVELAIFLLVTWQATQHLRHIAFVALLFAFWFTEHVDSALTQLRAKAAAGLPVTRLGPWMRNGATVLLGGAIAIQLVTLHDRLTTLPVFRNYYPVDAFEFMAERGVRGKLVVPFNWAQYAIAALAPQVQVAFDGRFDTCYPKEVIDMSFDFHLGDNFGLRHRAPESGPFDATKALKFCDPDLVMVDRQFKQCVEVVEREIAAHPDQWTLLYQDKLAQLWGRTNKYNASSSGDYLAPDQRIIGEHDTKTYVQWPALPRSKSGITTEQSEVAARHSLPLPAPPQGASAE